LGEFIENCGAIFNKLQTIRMRVKTSLLAWGLSTLGHTADSGTQAITGV
jgi:hypothetical protein